MTGNCMVKRARVSSLSSFWERFILSVVTVSNSSATVELEYFQRAHVRQNEEKEGEPLPPISTT
jgi:hypothetical protein